MPEHQFGTCSVCGRVRRVKKDGTMGMHRRLAANGYSRLSECPGVDQPPSGEVQPNA